MNRLSIIAWAGLALLAGCSGTKHFAPSSGSTSTTTSTGTTGTTGTTTTLALGNGSGTSFEAGVIAISTAALSAGGSTSLQVSVVNQTDALYTSPVTITFSSPCASLGTATIVATGSTPASPSVSTSTGTATATYTAAGCSGSDVITASANVDDQALSATGTVTVAKATTGAIKFISATPANIALRGVGSAGGSATSTVIFKVLDGSGGPRAGATATFALNTTSGGISIAPARAVTDANGEVRATVSGGTVATSVRVTGTTAASGGAMIATESDTLTAGW